MTADMILLLALLVTTLTLFVTEWLSVDVVTLLMLVALTVTGILTPAQAFAGFANEVIIILCAVFIVSGAVVKTGVMGRMAERLRRLPVSGQPGVIGSVMGFTATVSAFFSNTTATAILMPAAMAYTRDGRPGPARLLMPLAYASILGGSCTLIGTSTNMAASGLVQRMGMEGYGLFEFTAVGVVVALAGIGWMSLVGYRMPWRRNTGCRPTFRNSSFPMVRHCSVWVSATSNSTSGKSSHSRCYEKAGNCHRIPTAS
jgi:di/tricarboxylate transporter